MPTVEITPEELAVLQKLRREHAIPGAVGHPMPYDESTRPWGQTPPANPVTIQRLPTAQQWVDKQIRNLSAVGEQNYREGITHPKKDPIAAGIAAQPKYEAEMRKPEVLARRVTGLQATSTEEWAANSERVGAGRLVEGVVTRRAKVERKVQNLVSAMSSHLSRIDALPDVSDSDRERRMVENVRGLKAMKGRI